MSISLTVIRRLNTYVIHWELYHDYIADNASIVHDNRGDLDDPDTRNVDISLPETRIFIQRKDLISQGY